MARLSLEQLRANRPQVDRAKLDATTEADILRHTVEDGHDPEASVEGYQLIPAPAEIRKRLGQSQAAFADTIGVPLATLQNWEQGRKMPDPAAISLLRIMDREPTAAIRALHPANVIINRSAFENCIQGNVTACFEKPLKTLRSKGNGVLLVGTKTGAPVHITLHGAMPSKAKPIHRVSTLKPSKA